MPFAPPSISVVVCAYADERWNDLVAAVESLRRQTVAPLEIVVVVDHNPALLERARASLPGVTAIENREPRGLGGARNSGVAATRGEVIAFLDDDAAAAQDWVERLGDGYADPAVVGVGGAIDPIWEGGRPAWFPEEFLWVVGCTYRGMPERPAAVRNLIGCNMSFRREVFARLGAFRLGYGCDETEFCIRVRQRWPEAALLYQPAARVSHHVAAARPTWRYFRTRCYFEGGSKAVVTWLAGAQDALDSERAYTLRVLPGGVVRGLADALRGDWAGLGRAGAIAAGLAITAGGYLAGRVFTAEAARRRGWYEPARQASA